MNLKKINAFIAVAFAFVAFTSCEKDDGAIPNRVGIEEVPTITTALEAGGAAADIVLANQAAFQGKIVLSMFFPGNTPPDKIDVVVRKNGSAANVKVYKTNVTTLPANYTVTAAEIETLFGAPLAVKDTYDFAPDIYVGTKKYESFPANSLGVGQGPSGMNTIGYFPWVRFTVK
jgi:hypothetical protein